MATIENSELDFSELEELSEMELDIYFNLLIDQNSSYRSLFDDSDFVESLDLNDISESKKYYLKILDLFADWELFDYIEDIVFILENLLIIENNLKD